jgi:uncharacterized surface protein with fasciclin (FAS1) repeats
VIVILSNNLTNCFGFFHFMVCSTNAQPGNTIVDVASSDSDFTTLVDLVANASLVVALSGAGPLTVFTPTNAALALLGNETLALLANDLDLLRAILTYHVVPGNVSSSNL